MTMVEEICQCARQLSEDKAAEVLDFIGSDLVFLDTNVLVHASVVCAW